MRASIACAFALAAAPAGAAERDLSTDRPDRTESAYTVPAGRWQVEMDLVGWTRDRTGGTTTDHVGVATTNLKLGIHRRADLQLVVEPMVYESLRGDAGGDDGFELLGPSELTSRLKLNLWGNDGGSTALAVMPFVTFPTEAEVEAAGGVIVPLAFDVAGGWGAAVMGEVDVARGGRPIWIASATASHGIAGELGGYLEVFSAHGDSWAGTFDLGLTYGMTPDVQVDGGVNLGLSRESEDFTVFLGLSVRR